MKSNRVFSSLRVRLILLALLAVLPALGIVFYDAAKLREREVTRAQADALTLSHLAAKQHEEVIEATRQTLLTLAQLPEVIASDPTICQTRFTSLLEEYEAYNAFSLINRDGLVLCGTITSSTTEPISVADRLWFQQAIESGDFVVGNYQLGRADGTPIIVFAYPIVGQTGTVQGVVAASLRVDRLNQIAAEADLPADTTLTIIDEDGTVIVRQPEPGPWIGQTLPNEPLVIAIRTSGEGRTEVPDLDRVMRLYAFTPLHSTIDTGLYLSVGIPKAVAFAEADQIWTRNLLLLGIVSLLALAAAWLGSDLFVLRSVHSLIDATQRLRSDLTARTGLTHDAGELGTLARTFDELAVALEQRETERRQARRDLLALNASLEEQVVERTALIQLLQDVTSAANEATTLNEVLQFALNRVCAYTGWPVGHVYIPSSDATELISTDIWYLADPKRFGTFKQVTEDTRLAAGTMLPGQVLPTGQPVWMIDVSHNPDFIRVNEAQSGNIKAGFACPVLVDQEVVAVLEFFSEETVMPIESLQEIMAHMGTQLGRVVERQRAEAQIREREQLLAEAQHIAHVGSWQWEVTTNRLNWSDELCRIYGLPTEESSVTYEDFLARVHPGDLDRVRDIVEKAYQDHQPFNYEHRIVRPDGTVRMLHARGNIILNEQSQLMQMVGTGHDITELKLAEAEIRTLNAELEQRVAERTAQLETANHELGHEIEERKRAEAELESQRAFLRQVIDINPNLIFTKDRAGRFTLVNQAVAELYGTDVETIIGKTDADFNPVPEEVEHFRQDDLAVMDSLEEKFISEEIITDAKGHTRWLQTMKRPIMAENGHALQLLGVSADITERKRIEAELREQTEIIETVNRVGQTLAAELDHEKLVQTITDAATELSGAQFGALFYNVVNAEGESYTLYTLSGAPSEAFDKFPLPRNTKLFGPTFRGEGIVRIDNVKEDPRYGQNAPYHGMPPGHLPVTSYLAVPLVSRSGETIGGLFFGHARAGVFTDRTERLIAGLVAQASVSLDNARLYREAQTLNMELEQRVTDRTGQLQAANLLLQSEIAERTQAQEALQKSNAQFEGLFESAPDAIILVNDHGQIIELNRQTEALFGYERSELLDQPVEVLLPARFQSRHNDHRAAYYRDPHTRQMGFGLELYGRRRDGSEVPVDITLSPLTIEGENLVISIIRDITEHKQLEAELTTVQHQLLESSEAERLRIAQELHDGPIQELYGLSFRLGELEKALSDETGMGQLVASAVLVQQVTQNLRALCMELRPPTLAAFGLEQAILSHANHFQEIHPELTMHLELAQDGRQLPERTRLVLFRIYQEALNNIVKHAQAQQIRVQLSLDKAQVELMIQDDGHGFKLPRRWVHLAQAGHLGLVGMRERIQAIQGLLEINATPGAGTSIRAIVPHQVAVDSN